MPDARRGSCGIDRTEKELSFLGGNGGGWVSQHIFTLGPALLSTQLIFPFSMEKKTNLDPAEEQARLAEVHAIVGGCFGCELGWHRSIGQEGAHKIRCARRMKRVEQAVSQHEPKSGTKYKARGAAVTGLIEELEMQLNNG
jgi:hypothetical protein